MSRTDYRKVGGVGSRQDVLVPVMRVQSLKCWTTSQEVEGVATLAAQGYTPAQLTRAKPNYTSYSCTVQVKPYVILLQQQYYRLILKLYSHIMFLMTCRIASCIAG